MLKLILKFFISDVFAKGVAVLLLPIYSILMGPNQLGQFSEWFSAYNIVAAIISLGIPSYFLVLHGSKTNNSYILSAQFLSFFKKWLVIITPIILFIFTVFKSLLFAMSILVASVSFTYITYIEATLRAEEKIKHYFCLGIFLTLVTSVFPLIIVMISPIGASRSLGYSIGVLMLAFVLAVFFSPSLPKINTSKSFNKSTILFGLPIVLITGINWLKLSVDIQLLKGLNDYHDSGILFFTFQVVSIINIIAASLNRASTASFYELIAENKMDLFNKLIFKIILILASITFFMIFLISVAVNQFLPDFSEASYLLYPMSLGVIVYALGQFIASFFMFYEKTYILTLAILLSSLIHPFISYYIIQNIGWHALGYSYLISSVIFFALTVLFKSKFLFLNMSGIVRAGESS